MTIHALLTQVTMSAMLIFAAGLRTPPTVWRYLREWLVTKMRWDWFPVRAFLNANVLRFPLMCLWNRCDHNFGMGEGEIGPSCWKNILKSAFWLSLQVFSSVYECRLVVHMSFIWDIGFVGSGVWNHCKEAHKCDSAQWGAIDSLQPLNAFMFEERYGLLHQLSSKKKIYGGFSVCLLFLCYVGGCSYIWIRKPVGIMTTEITPRRYLFIQSGCIPLRRFNCRAALRVVVWSTSRSGNAYSSFCQSSYKNFLCMYSQYLSLRSSLL